MSGYSYIEQRYGRTFEPGQPVRFTECRGNGRSTIGAVMPPKRSHEHYVQVRFDDEKHGSLCHPLSVMPAK